MKNNGILKLIIDERIPARQNKQDNVVSCIAASGHRFGATMSEYQILEKFAQKYRCFEIQCTTGSHAEWTYPIGKGVLKKYPN